ncbi:hypothetical protein HYI36_18540 [Bacillus sp. Gen3]|nr:hypothetical protein [Bacillus sp. Gen3]
MVNAVRKAIESQYKGICTITEYQSYKDPVTKRTSHREVDVLINQPCKLSFKTISSTGENDHVGTVEQVVKLFIAPEISIKAGSKITVTQNGKTNEYSQSGVPAFYTHHQEIILELFKGWS